MDDDACRVVRGKDMEQGFALKRKPLFHRIMLEFKFRSLKLTFQYFAVYQLFTLQYTAAMCDEAAKQHCTDKGSCAKPYLSVKNMPYPGQLMHFE